MDRAYRELVVKGIAAYSNGNFGPFASSEFCLICARAEKLGPPIFIHPGISLTMEMTNKHKVNFGFYGFALGPSTTATSLISQGGFDIDFG